MSYTKQTWETGDIITAEKLNHMEDGISEGGGGVLVVHDVDGTLDKTWQEIYDAPFAIMKIHQTGEGSEAAYPVLLTVGYDTTQGIYVVMYQRNYQSQPESYVTQTPDDYPSNNIK